MTKTFNIKSSSIKGNRKKIGDNIVLIPKTCYKYLEPEIKKEIFKIRIKDSELLYKLKESPFEMLKFNFNIKENRTKIDNEYHKTYINQVINRDFLEIECDLFHKNPSLLITLCTKFVNDDYLAPYFYPETILDLVTLISNLIFDTNINKNEISFFVFDRGYLLTNVKSDFDRRIFSIYNDLTESNIISDKNERYYRVSRLTYDVNNKILQPTR